ncbi:AraC family transcriptional regulator [Paenibacillus sp. 1P07SE]|uniref:AraC family transcriptional regulator n=1 Tax=Paenibacillus sp. 1P07SE TaxID=3132209 RepID=UPI0039A40CD3
MACKLIDVRNRGKAICEPGWNWQPGALQDYDLWYAMQGSGVMRINSDVFPIRKGACFLVHPGDTPTAEQDPDDRLTVIYIHFQLSPCTGDSEDDSMGKLMRERVVYFNEVYEPERLLHQLLDTSQHPDEWSSAEFDCIGKQLLIHRQRCLEQQLASPGSTLTTKQRQAVRQVMRTIQEEGWHGRPYDELADMVGLSHAYLAKLFKGYTGRSMKEYMTEMRLERAKHLLSESSMNVSQVADALGYSSVYLFSKQFKRYTGMPPSAFQMHHAKARPH